MCIKLHKTENWIEREGSREDESERKCTMRYLPNRKLARQTKVKPPNMAHRPLVICIRIDTNSDRRKSMNAIYRDEITGSCIKDARVVCRLKKYVIAFSNNVDANTI